MYTCACRRIADGQARPSLRPIVHVMRCVASCLASAIGTTMQPWLAACRARTAKQRLPRLACIQVRPRVQQLHATCIPQGWCTGWQPHRQRPRVPVADEASACNSQDAHRGRFCERGGQTVAETVIRMGHIAHMAIGCRGGAMPRLKSACRRACICLATVAKLHGRNHCHLSAVNDWKAA